MSLKNNNRNYDSFYILMDVKYFDHNAIDYEKIVSIYTG